MPVTIMSDPLKALKGSAVTGVAAPAVALSDAAAKGKIKVISTLQAVKVLAPDNEILTSIKLTPADLAAISVGSWEGDYEALAAIMTIATAQSLKEAGPAPTLLTPVELKQNDPGPAMHLLKPGKVAGKPVPPDPPAKPEPVVSAPVSDYPVLKVTNGNDVIHLREATGLYRKVQGSDSSSRYFLVADFGDLKMAVRWKGGKMSVRFEAKSNKLAEKYSTRMAELGMIMNAQHASAHLEVDNLVDASKLVGAMILGSGEMLLSPLPNMAVIKDKGV
jgi:hypothetical protein